MKFNNETLRKAVKEWLENEESAKAKYGHISNWDTSEVTDITDIYFRAKSMNIDITNWSLNFEENGLFFKQNKSGDLLGGEQSGFINDIGFDAYHENGNKRIEYLNADYEYYLHSCSKIVANKDTKISTYDENGTELKEVTIFLTPNKGDSMIVFKTAIDNYANFHEGNFTETNYLSNYINDRHHIINLTGSDEFDLKKYPPVIISVPSQFVLRTIAQFIPDKKFVLIFRWENLNDNTLDDIYDLPQEQQKFIGAYDEIWISANNKDEYGNHLDDEVTDFPGSKTMQLFGFEWIYLDDYRKYDYLRLYEEDVFNSLKVLEDEDDQYEDDDIRFEPSLILDVEEYERELTFK